MYSDTPSLIKVEEGEKRQNESRLVVETKCFSTIEYHLLTSKKNFLKSTGIPSGSTDRATVCHSDTFVLFVRSSDWAFPNRQVLICSPTVVQKVREEVFRILLANDGGRGRSEEVLCSWDFWQVFLGELGEIVRGQVSSLGRPGAGCWSKAPWRCGVEKRGKLAQTQVPWCAGGRAFRFFRAWDLSLKSAGFCWEMSMRALATMRPGGDTRVTSINWFIQLKRNNGKILNVWQLWRAN